MSSTINRREFIAGSCLALAAGAAPRRNSAWAKEPKSPVGQIGLTTGSLNTQRANKTLTALTLPKFMRDELGMQLIDLNTNWLTSYESGYLEQVRGETEAAGCFISNLKVNHDYGDLYAQDAAARKRAEQNSRELIRAAQLLGARWIRFGVPKFASGAEPSSLAPHRALAAAAAEQGLQLLVENNHWMRSDPDSVRRVVRAIGDNAVAGPDTGNWTDAARYLGLERSFPGAVTCDFKVFELDADRQHTKYDIRRCFEIGRQAEFRGPWAIEHWNQDTAAFAREVVYLRDLLKQWIAEA